MPRLTFIFLLSILIMATAIAQNAGRERVFPFDAVELIDNKKEVEGKADHQHKHGRSTYLFATAANLESFKANAAKYEIQLGGACGRMGPLSGEGSPKLFAVHDGRLYVFASEQCRRSFLAGPERFLERDDPRPEVNDELLRKGEITITMIAANAGLLREDDPPITLRQRLARIEESGGKANAITETVTLMLPDGVRSESCWNESCWSNTARGDAAWSTDLNGTETLAEAQRHALLRDAGRHPWMLASQRAQPGFLAVNSGERRIVRIDGEEDQECSVVTVHWQGATTTMAVDGAGRCRVMSYRGRGPDATIGEIEKVFSKFHIIDRYELPGHVRTTFNGKPVAELSGDYDQQAVNDPADLSRFKRPANAAK